jgi:hypothetical protein
MFVEARIGGLYRQVGNHWPTNLDRRLLLVAGSSHRFDPTALILSSTRVMPDMKTLLLTGNRKKPLVGDLSLPRVHGGDGLMAYAVDLGELGRRIADDVHQILNGIKPGDIPIYQPVKYDSSSI